MNTKQLIIFLLIALLAFNCSAHSIYKRQDADVGAGAGGAGAGAGAGEVENPNPTDPGNNDPKDPVVSDPNRTNQARRTNSIIT